MGISEVTRIVTRLHPDAIEQLLEMLHDVARFVRENEEPEQGVRIALTAFLTSLPPPD